jgi:hypothetical protein
MVPAPVLSFPTINLPKTWYQRPSFHFQLSAYRENGTSTRPFVSNYQPTENMVPAPVLSYITFSHMLLMYVRCADDGPKEADIPHGLTLCSHFLQSLCT